MCDSANQEFSITTAVAKLVRFCGKATVVGTFLIMVRVNVRAGDCFKELDLQLSLPVLSTIS